MSELSGIRNENDLLNRLAEVERAVASLQRQNLRVGALSEMSADLGEFWGGDIFALESGLYPDDPNATGVFLSMNGYTIDGVTYRFGAVKNGHIVLGVTTEGQTVTGGGSGLLDQGIVLNGVLTILEQLAIYSSIARRMTMRMNLPNETNIPSGNLIPAASWEYREPAPSELLDNGTFNTDVDHWYGVTSKSSGYSGKYAEMMGALAPGTTNGAILCIEITSSGDIYVGGSFTIINGVAANRIAKYTKNTGLWSALGSGANDEVWGIAVNGNTVYATGKFTSIGGVAVNYVAYYDGSWHAMGSGLSGGYGYCIDIDSSSDVFVGGTFTSAGGVANTQGVALWTGSWNSLLGGTNGSVYSIRVDYGDYIWVGGVFTLAGSKACANFAMCDITDDWYGTCVPNNAVLDIAESWGGHIYVVGDFTEVDGSECNHIFHWDPFLWDWSQCGNGIVGSPKSVTAYVPPGGYDDVIVVGGNITEASGIECNNLVAFNTASGFWENNYGNGLNSTCWVVEADSNWDNVVFGGQFSMVDNTATYVGYLCQAVSCDAVSITSGDHSPYDFSGYINNPKGKEFALLVQWLDASNVVLSSETITQNALVSTWKQYTRRLTKPDGAEKVKIVLRIVNASDILFPNIGLDSFSLTEELADTYGIMLHPYPLAIIDSAVERIVSASAFRLFSPRTPTISLVATASGNCTNGAHKVKVVFRDAYGSSLASAESNSVTVDNSNKQIRVPLELGPWGTSARDVYMTKAGGSTFYLAKQVEDNTTTTTDVSVADADLVTTEPAVNTSGSRALKRHYFTVHGHEVRTSVALTRPTSQIDLAYTAAAAANNGDEFYFDFDCVGGTYTLVYILWHSTYFGKVDIYIDNAPVESGYDLYSSGGAVDIHTRTGITITGDGVHTLMFKVNGKNGSSTDYSFGAVMISGYRTGD